MDCLTRQAMLTVHGQHFFCPQKPQNAMLFYRGTRIQGHCHLVTAAPSLVMHIQIIARRNKTR
jgi:hypothetical protein